MLRSLQQAQARSEMRTSPGTADSGSDSCQVPTPPPTSQTAHLDAHTLPAPSLSLSPTSLLPSGLLPVPPSSPAYLRRTRSDLRSLLDSSPRSGFPPRCLPARCTLPTTPGNLP